MNRIFPALAITLLLLFNGCGLFGPPEESRQQSGHTVYRVPGGSAAEIPSPTPVPQKIPGESKKN
ncbi:MAG TPA: hypothetical protein VKS98_03905 [Chthoniobacterales bacterium]|nr:hypothetical protein [Chthoniobacterales bacterium]